MTFDQTEYNHLLYSLADKYPKIIRSTLHLYPNSATTALVRGSVFFTTGLELRIFEYLDWTDGEILDYSYTLPFADSWFLLFRANAVASDDPLVDVERYRVGGPDSVRAFPSAELAGDGGGFASIDVGKSFFQRRGLRYTAKIFADAGRVTRKLPAPGENSSDSIAGYGVGFSASIDRQHIIELQVVDPSGDRVSSDNRDTRVWVSYSAQL